MDLSGMGIAVIGERINMTRKRVREKVWERDAGFIIQEVRKQQDAGATYIDVNAGGDPAKEVDDMKWLIETILPVAECPLVVDSASPAAIRAAMSLIGSREGTIINSISGEKERLEGILPLAVEYRTGLVAMLNSGTGMPKGVRDRMENAEMLAEAMNRAGIPSDRQYFDPLVFPVSTDSTQPGIVIETTRELKKRWPSAHVSYGLSNVSYGLPRRVMINAAFAAILVTAGGDAFMIDPTQPEMMGALLGACALLGKDEFCVNYLQAARSGVLGGAQKE
ncbi:MAG: dihydropteroate synthase [Planctomycetota bacterium]|nr:dihydropteroate synthase [Planctomycetota bacterium]